MAYNDSSRAHKHYGLIGFDKDLTGGIQTVQLISNCNIYPSFLPMLQWCAPLLFTILINSIFYLCIVKYITVKA